MPFKGLLKSLYYFPNTPYIYNLSLNHFFNGVLLYYFSLWFPADLQVGLFRAKQIFPDSQRMARQINLPPQCDASQIDSSQSHQILRAATNSSGRNVSMWLWMICGLASTDVCPNADVMEKASPCCPGFSQHARNTAPNWSSLTLTFSYSSSLALARSVSELSVLSSLVRAVLCLIKLEDNGYFNGSIVNLRKH